MSKRQLLPYRDTGFFSSLICDYLEQKPALAPFYHRFPGDENLPRQQEEKLASYTSAQRKLLVAALERQYAQDGVEIPPAVRANLEDLALNDTCTVCTGHQLNILLGPLYTVYKIIHTINLARAWDRQGKRGRVLPVFWLASEDHDWEEINFIHYFGGVLRWQGPQGGAVGHLPPFGMGKVLDELEQHLGPGEHARDLMSIFRQAYHDRSNLAAATRALVNRLFGEDGLLIIDGDDPELKASQRELWEEELQAEKMHQVLQESNAELERHYFLQAHARRINLFYLRSGHRNRLEKAGEGWQVLDSDLYFTAAELSAELQNKPERFSPNALLRPVYQERLLPNLAYIGGGGEIAYWLQLKAAFAAFSTPFPMLVLRNSVLWIDHKWQNRMQDLDLKPANLFAGLEGLQNAYAAQKAPVDPQLADYEARLQAIFAELEEIAHLTEESMLGAVNAQKQKQLNGLQNLRKKLIRAEKRRNKTEMDKLARIHGALFPKGGLQERHDNFSAYYVRYGPDFFQRLQTDLDPLDFRFTILGD